MMKFISFLFLLIITGINADAQDSIQKKKPLVFTFVQQMPEFSGGDKELVKFLQKNIRYPAEARETNIEGTVIVQFIVNEDSSISDIKALRPVGGGCTEEALRVVKLMPKWKPGMQNGTPVKVYFNLPVAFKLSSGKDKPPSK